MKHGCAILAFGFIAAAHVFASDEGRDHFDSKLDVGKHIISVHITQVPFDRTKHLVADGKVDGHIAELGADGGIPDDEIGLFQVSVDGKHLDIPRTLYGDCYSPILTESALGGVFVLPSSDGESILICMKSFRAASAVYTVYWTIRFDGKYARYVDGPSS